MKKLLFTFTLAFMGISVAFGQLTYCPAGPSSAADSEISSVVLNGQTTNINYQQICPGTLNVNNQRANHAADLVISNTYTVNVGFGTCSGFFYTSMGTAYIDWNGNGTFEPSEAIGTTAAVMPPITNTYTFTVPVTALPGSTVMRVMQWETSGQPLPLNPCATMTWGSVIDFTINIIPPGPCVGATVANAISNVGSICVGQTANLTATNVSFGIGTVYQWQASVDSTNWVNITGAGTVNYTTGPIMGTTFYRLQVTCGASVATSVPVKVIAIGTPLPGGTYTINSLLPTGGTNFISFTDFFTQTNCGGIVGPVILNVAPGTGPYNERVLVGAIGGSSAINTLTINGNGEVLEFSNTDNTRRATLTFEGSSNVVLNGLVVRALGTAVGYGIQLRNGTNNVIIKNCQIEIPLAVTSINFAGIVLNSGLSPTTAAANFPFNNTLDSNTIIGGYFGISLMGASSASRAVGNKVLRNTIRDFHFYGIYSGSQEDFEYIGNNISRPTRTTLTSFYGIFFTTEHHGGNISKNAIHSPFATQTTSASVIYPFYSTGASGTVAKPNNVFNNIFYNLEGFGTLYGIWGATSSNWNYYHNTIHIDHIAPTAALTYAFYISGNSDNVNFRNNIISLRRGGTSAKFAVYVLGTGTRNINNNGYFVDYAVGNTSFGFIGSAQANFTLWRGNTFGWDNNSVFENPNFLFPAGGLLTPTAGGLDNIGFNFLSIVPTDYNDSARTITPDPGAFEFQGPACSNPVGFASGTVTPTSMQLSWNQPGTSVNTWDIEWGPVGFTPGTTGNNRVTVTTNPYTLGSLTPGFCYHVYIRANCTNLGLGSGAWVGPVERCLPYAHDIAIVDLVNPLSPTGCGDSTMPVRVAILNNSVNPAVNVNLRAVISGSVTQTINFTYPGPLAPNAADTITLGTINTYLGGTINVAISNVWTLDQNPANDTLTKNNITILPAVPIALPAFACANQDSVSLTMQAAGNASYLWFSQPTGGTPIFVGNPYRVPVSNPGPYYVEYQSGVSGSLPTINTGGSGCGAGNMFDLVPTRTMSITGFDIRPFGTSSTHAVAIYMVTGSHTSLTGQTGWTLVHQTTINATVNVLTTVMLPNPVLLNANQVYGFYVQHNASYTVGANTYSNNDLTFISGNGNCVAFDYCCTPRTFNGAIHYEIAGCQSPRVPVSATVYQDTASAAFSFNQTGPGNFSFDATASTGNLFNWSFGDGGTATGRTPSHTYNTAGNFSVTLVVTDTVCGTVDSVTINATSTISLEEFLINQNLRVYPNPSRDVFNIEFEMEGVRDLYIRVISPTGQRVFEENAGKHANTYRKAIDLGAFAKGIYILQIQTENGIVSRRLSLM